MDSLKNKYDALEAKVNELLDMRLERSITPEMYDKKLSDLKEKQADILEQMKEHSEGDHQFYLAANMVLNLANRAEEIFESSEIQEKRQMLNFLLQNCTLSGQNLRFDLKEPFNLIVATRHYPIGLAWQDAFRTFDWASAFPYPTVALQQIKLLLTTKETTRVTSQSTPS